jgi:hypothetical protein
MRTSQPPKPTPIHPAVSAALNGGPVPTDPVVLSELSTADREMVRIMTRLSTPHRGTAPPTVRKMRDK